MRPDLPDPVVERFNEQTLAGDGYHLHSRGHVYHAIAIGDRSAIDRCYIMSASDWSSPKSTGLVESVRQEFVAGAHLVSVERPFVGCIRGPVLIAPAYSQTAYNAGRFRNSPEVLFAADEALPEGSLHANLDLAFYQCPPPFLPTKRAPVDWVGHYPNFGTAGGLANPAEVRFPGWGRKEVSLSLEMSGRTAGDFNWSFIGANSALSSAAVVTIDHVLQPVTVQAANFEETFLFDGEFDFYVLTITEANALNAGVTIDVIWKARD